MAGEPSDPHPGTADADVLLVDFEGGGDGHRGQYNAMLAVLFRLRAARFGWTTLLARQPILVPQIEHDPLRFLIACLVRAVPGRRTVGLLLRPLPALHGTSLRLRMKRAVLKLLRIVPGARVLTIVPFAVEPRLGEIAHGWIHDLQNWDFTLGSAADPAASQRTAAAIRAGAAGRPVCCAIGGQSREKGFDRFVEAWLASPELRRSVLFAFGGKVAPDLADAARCFVEQGGHALDRVVSDAELFGLYQAADLIWCAYDPSYDQASGILGRAMQFGLPVVVRPGSVIERICHAAGHPCIAFDGESDPIPLRHIPSRLAPDHARARAAEQGALSLTRLADALGVEPAVTLDASRSGVVRPEPREVRKARA
jgi:hypothetical protein